MLSAQPASASAGEELSASEAAQVVAEAVAVEGVPAATGAAEVTQSSQGVVADVPNSPVSLVLPDAEVTGQTASATVVEGVGDSQAVVQEVGAQGQRVAFIINDPTDPTEYQVDFDGAATLEMDSTGAVMVLDAQSQLLALISPPWARDANGTEVPTRFVVEGTTLTQVVDHTTGAFAYPIAADPNVFVCGWGTCSLYIGRAQTARIANFVSRYAWSTQAAMAFAFGAACAPLGGWAVICAGAAGVGGGFAIDQFTYARATNSCVRLRAVRVPWGWGLVTTGVYVDKGGYCTA